MLYTRNVKPEIVVFGRCFANEINTNMPLAETIWGSTTETYGPIIDLTDFTMARWSGFVQQVGATGAVVRMKYSLTPYSAHAAFGPDVSLEQLVQVNTDWFQIPKLARVDAVMLTIWGQGGDGAADPTLRGPLLELR